jgi:hypothetical protein
MAQVMGFNRFQSSCADCLLNVANNPGLSILAVNGFNEVFLFHTVQYHSQNLFCSESKLLGLSGGGTRADCYRVDSTSSFQDVEIQTPSWRDLKGAITPEAVSLLQVAEQNPRTHHSSASPDNNPRVEYYGSCTLDPYTLGKVPRF